MRRLITVCGCVLLPAIFASQSMAQQSKTLTATADSYVAADAPNNNFGGELNISIGTHTEVLGFVTFNISSIPSGSIVNSATLRMYPTTLISSDSVAISRVSGSWSENGVTWNNRPGWNLPVLTSTPPGTFQWWTIDVTSIVKKWVEDGATNYGFYLEGSSGIVQVNSRQSSNKPQLLVSYTPTNVDPVIDVIEPSSDKTVTQGDSVYISWDGTDPDDAASVLLYYDSDCNTDNGGWTLITGSVQPEDGSYWWHTDNVQPGIYRVHATISDGIGNPGFDCATGTVTIQCQTPSAPSATANTGPASGEIVLSWSPVSALGYVIVYDDDPNNPPWSPNPDGMPNSGSDIGNVTTITITGLTPDQLYYLAVAAYNSCGLGIYSSVVTARAQDGNTEESVKLVALTSLTTGLATQSFQVVCSAFVNNTELTTLQIGWDWTTNSATLQMDSAVASAAFNAMDIGPFFFLDNVLATTNDSQVAIASATSILTNFPISSSWQHVCTYYMTVKNWTASSSLIIDTVQLPGIASTDFLFVPVGGTDYDPVWGGPINISGTAVEESITDVLPISFQLEQNYPHPFNPETRIEFSLPRASHVTIDIFNVLGQHVRNLVNERLSAGNKAVTWEGKDNTGKHVTSGVYFYKFVAEDFVKSKKMVLLQ